MRTEVFYQVHQRKAVLQHSKFYTSVKIFSRE